MAHSKKKKKKRERENSEKWLTFGKGLGFDQQNSKHSTSFPTRSFGMLWGLVVIAGGNSDAVLP